MQAERAQFQVIQLRKLKDSNTRTSKRHRLITHPKSAINRNQTLPIKHLMFLGGKSTNTELGKAKLYPHRQKILDASLLVGSGKGLPKEIPTVTT